MSPRRVSALSILAIVAFGAFFFAPELFGNRMLVTASMARWLPWQATASPDEQASVSMHPDCALSYYPRHARMHESWKAGEIPYWNPYSFCGAPFFADPQVGVLYPPNWPLLPFDPGRQLGYKVFLHALWGGIGAWLLARRFASNAWVPLAAGCAFAVNGYFTKHLGHPVFHAGASWMPWTIALALRMHDRPTLRRAALLGGAGALTFLAGQPQTAFHAAYASALVVAATWLTRPPTERPRLPRLARAAFAAAAIAGLLVAAQLLPTLELVGRSARSVLPFETIVSGAFHPADVIRFVIPDFFGSPVNAGEWSALFSRGDGFFPRNHFNSILAGGPVFVLAIWGMIAPRTWRRSLPFTLLFLVSTLVAFGSPLSKWVHEWVPGFRFSRIDRIAALVIVSQFVPAVLGAMDLAQPRRWAHRAYGIAWIVLSAVFVAVVWRQGAAIPAFLGSSLPGPAPELADATVDLIRQRTIAGLSWVGAAAVFFVAPARRWVPALPLSAAVVQLFLCALPYRMDRDPGTVFPVTPSIPKLAELLDRDARQGGYRLIRFGRDQPLLSTVRSSVLPPSTNVPYRLRDLQGYNALNDRRLGATLEIATGEPLFSQGLMANRRIAAPVRTRSLEHPLLAALSVGAAIGVEPFRATGWESIDGAEFAIATNAAALPRVRFAREARGVPEAELERILRDAEFDPRDAYWVGDGAVPSPTGDEASYAEVIAESANELRVRTRANGERLLVVADSFARGWRAEIDGEPVEIVRVFGIVRGVRVPSGTHVVEMRYRPPGLVVGSVVSLVGLLTFGLLVTLGGVRRKLVETTRVP